MRVAATLVLLGFGTAGAARGEAAALTAKDLAGTWAGTLTHDGETEPIALDLVPAADGKVTLKATIPITHVVQAGFGTAEMTIEGNQAKLGPFVFTYDAAAGTLSGNVPAGLAPVYDLAFTLKRVDHFDVPPRPEPTAPLVRPAWTFDAGAAIWAGPTFADGVVYAGGTDGKVHALDARTGHERWSFAAGGPVRTRPTIAGSDVYFQADDGQLYKLAAATGQERWRVRVVEKPIERLPFDNPQSRYDSFGSAVVVSGGRLYLGTHDGKLLALEPEKGARVWEFAAGDAVLSAPVVAGGRVYFGSYDHFVYALDAAKGQLAWKQDTKGAVVNTPAVSADGATLVIGNRAYDLLGLDARTGEPRWKRYFWFSWVESSATIKDGIAYVGSSDAAAAYAYDVKSGERRWKTDVFGWAWGQPAVTDKRVYIGHSSQAGYLAGHRGGLMALDRATGKPVWRYTSEEAKSGPYGIPGSAAVGQGLVFVGGLDGKVYAFAE
jgi:outer membrane protein assembly factor BamB